jgi:hypothetical protein
LIFKSPENQIFDHTNIFSIKFGQKNRTKNRTKKSDKKIGQKIGQKNRTKKSDKKLGRQIRKKIRTYWPHHSGQYGPSEAAARDSSVVIENFGFAVEEAAVAEAALDALDLIDDSWNKLI